MMMTPTPSALAELEYRYERKYHAWDRSPQELVQMLKQHPSHFVDAYPSRWVNNIYFDSPSLRNFTDHVNGAPRRAKLRIRWYGPAHGAINQPVLEVKIKRGEAGAKLHYSVSAFDFDGRIALESLRRDLRAQGSEAAGLLCASEPSLFNRYRRRYFRTVDNRYRMTVDTDMSFHVVNGKSWGLLSEYRERRLAVLELKYDVSDDPGAAAVGAGLPFLLGKNSKYVFGIQCLSGTRE